MRCLLPRLPTTKRKINGEGSSSTHLYLNVYDLTPMNNYLYWFGLGIYHSGIEVHGMEYSFGAHEHPSSGVFEVEPRSCPGFIYRRTVWLGTTNLSPAEFRLFIEQLAQKYRGDSYHLMVKNCNHFTNDVCIHLTGKPVPGWVNRLANLGSLLNCLLPENINVRAIRHLPDHPAFPGEDGLTGNESDSYDTTLEESELDESDHRLLMASNVDLPRLKEKPSKSIRNKF
ncbi:hypothetical protein HPP92_002100 [Vanilla planifolia]|uniref:PPPDE domain-containing protein n=1 Tax=Vanilla planifolia TaxID=51239 RepID=A0A835VE67_VANPL|nr:hypothetical protein HPP92_002100 [Vanilla planifolia]